MAVEFPYETAQRSAGVTADAPDVTDDMITAGTGVVPEGQTADEAFGRITDGRTYSQELGEGFQRGQDQTSSMVAMGLETIATAIGADGVANFARERSEILDEEARKHPASVASYTDVKDFESGAKFALGLVGEQGPQLLVDAGAAVASGGMSAAVTVGFRKGVTAAIVKQAFTKGAWRGMAASQFAQNTGESRKMQLAEGVDDPLQAMKAAAGKTVLDYAASRVMVRSALSLANRGLKAEAAQLLSEWLKSSGMEGITEGMQAAVDHMVIAGNKAGYRVDTQEVADDIINSFIAGALVGGTPAAVHATLKTVQQTGKLTTDMLGKHREANRAEIEPEDGGATAENEPVPSVSGEAQVLDAGAAEMSSADPTAQQPTGQQEQVADPQQEATNYGQVSEPAAADTEVSQAAAPDQQAGQADVPQNRQTPALWSTRRRGFLDDADVGVADDGTGVPVTAAAANEQPSLITEEQRSRAAAISAPIQHASVDANGPIVDEADPAPDTVFEKGTVEKHKTGFLRSALAGITKANDARRAEEAAEQFTSEENAPKERADNRELGASMVSAGDFLASANMATSENDRADAFSEESKRANDKEISDALNEFSNAHNDAVGSFSVTDNANRDAETDSIFDAVRRGIDKAQRSVTRTAILKTSLADPKAAEKLEVPKEKLVAVKDAARRDQNSTWVTPQSFVYFQDERNSENVFPVYMPDAVMGVMASPHTMANKTEGNSRTKIATALGDIISAMAEEGYHPVSVNTKGETVPFADAYANAPVAYAGKTALKGESNVVTLADLSKPDATKIYGQHSDFNSVNDEVAMLNRERIREDKLELLKRAITHFEARGASTPQRVIDALKSRVAALEYAESLAARDNAPAAERDALNERKNNASAVLAQIRSLAYELGHRNKQSDIEAFEADFARLSSRLEAALKAKVAGEELQQIRDALTSARDGMVGADAAKVSLAEISVHDMLELVDSKLLEAREEAAARPEVGTHERFAESKPDAEQEGDRFEATPDVTKNDMTSALFALRRTNGADARLAQADTREALTTHSRGKRVPPSEADVASFNAELAANMEANGAKVAATPDVVIASDSMLAQGGLLARVNEVAKDVGVAGKVAIVRADLGGAMASVSIMDGGALIKVDSTLFESASPEVREAVLMHELGHVVVSQIISAADPKVLRRLAADFDSYRAGLDADHPYNKNTTAGFDEYLADQFSAYVRNREKKSVATSGKRGGVDAVFADIKRKLEKLVAAISNFVFGTDRLAGTKVGFQFMESMFAAARNSRRGATGSNDFFEAWMRQVYDNPNRQLRSRKEVAQAAGISDDGSTLPSRDFDLNKARDTAGGIVNGIIGAVKNPVDAGRKLAAAADRMHRELPIFITAREELKGISKTLMEKYDRVFDGSRADIDAWQQRVHRIFKQIHADPKQEQELADYINGKGELPTAIKTYLADLYKHVKQTLPTLNELQDYFPRMYDLEALNERKDEFLNMLMTEAKMSPDAAKSAWHNIVNGKNIYTAEVAPEVSAHGSTFQNAKTRMLPNVTDEMLRQHGFLQNDIHAVLLHYTQKSVRMSHYAKHFAQYTSLRHTSDTLREFLPGIMFDDSDSVKAKNRKLLTWLLRDKVPLFDPRTGEPLSETEKMRQIKEPSDDDDFITMNMPFIKQAIDQQWIIPENRKGQVTFAFFDMNAGLREEVKLLPVEQQRRVAMIVDAYEGRLAADKLSPKARNLMSNIVAYQNLRTMLFSTFTSLADASGLVFKGGDFRGALMNLKDIGSIIGEMRRGEKLQLFRDLGYAERQSSMQAFMEAYGIQYQSKTSAKVNNMLFTLNGQIALTNGIRLIGAALAERHIQRAVKDIAHGTEAQRDNAQAMLHDLGISTSDAAALHDDYKRYNYYVDSGDTTSAEAQQAFRLHEAVNKYVDSAITRPDARARPVWGSDPRFMLLYQFKSFIFAYWEKIMKPVLAESGRRFNATNGSRMAKAAAAAAPLAVFVLPTVALSALGLWLRQLLQYEVWGDEAPAKQMELPEYTYEVIKRGGILGPFELGFSFVENNAEGRSGVTQLMGPTASHLELLLKGDTEKSIGASTPVFSQIPALREWAKGMFQ